MGPLSSLESGVYRIAFQADRPDGTPAGGHVYFSIVATPTGAPDWETLPPAFADASAAAFFNDVNGAERFGLYHLAADVFHAFAFSRVAALRWAGITVRVGPTERVGARTDLGDDPAFYPSSPLYRV